VHTPAEIATAYSCPRVSTPNAAAAGTEPMISIRAASHQIISHRLGRRSTMAPAGSAISAKARVDAEVSRPTWNVDARSTTTAVSGSASRVTAEPISLTVCPLHSSMKSRCRQSGRGGAGSAGCSAPARGGRGPVIWMSPDTVNTLPRPVAVCPGG
jgi:hypothetical protein